MHIARLTAFHVRVPLRQTVTHASFSRASNDTLVVCCELSDGTVGWGEGLPRPYVTGESIETVWEQLQRTDFAAQLGGAVPSLPAALEMLSGFIVSPLPENADLESEISNTRSEISNLRSQISDFKSQISNLTSEISDFKSEISDLKFQISDFKSPSRDGLGNRSRDGLGNKSRDCLGNAVRCAVELSILDAVCRREGHPLSHVTCLVPEADPIRHTSLRVQYSGVITAMTPLSQLRSVLKQRLYGFRQCKLKLGAAGMDDVATLRRARGVLGRRVDLRVDVNGAWTCAELPAKLEQLVPFGITAVEQPVPHAEVACLAEIRRQAVVPIMLDESLCSRTDAERVIDEGLCDLFNIRLSKCGGFVTSLQLAAMAHAAGLGYQLGCQVGETGILSAAGRHFATSVGGLRYLEGSYDRHLVAERLTVEDLTFGYAGFAPALTAPGLGVTVDRTALARCMVRNLPLMER